MCRAEEDEGWAGHDIAPRAPRWLPLLAVQVHQSKLHCSVRKCYRERPPSGIIVAQVRCLGAQRSVRAGGSMRPCSTLGRKASCSELTFRCAVARALPVRQMRHNGAPFAAKELLFRALHSSDGHPITAVSSSCLFTPFWPLFMFTQSKLSTFHVMMLSVSLDRSFTCMHCLCAVAWLWPGAGSAQ